MRCNSFDFTIFKNFQLFKTENYYINLINKIYDYILIYLVGKVILLILI